METSKICRGCEKDLPLDNFSTYIHPNKRTYHYPRCKPCRVKYEQRRYRSNPKIRATKADKAKARAPEDLAKRRQRYAEDPEFRAYLAGHAKRRIEVNQAYIHQYLQEHPCVDCGETDIVVLEFDHINKEDKTENIARMIRSSALERLKIEVAKCQVLCANDHKRRTAKQFGWKKAQVAKI